MHYPKFCTAIDQQKKRVAMFAACIIAIMTALSQSDADADTMHDAIQVEHIGNPKGQDIILIPGLASGGEIWHATAMALAQDYDIHIVTLAGFAGVAPSQEAIIDPSLDALKAYAQAQHMEHPIVIGHSMGGFMALKWAAQNDGADLGGIMVVDSVPFLAGLFNPAATLESATAQAQQFKTILSSMPHDAFIAQQKAGVVRMTKDADTLETLQHWSETSDQNSVATAFFELMSTDLRPTLSQITTPVHVLMAYDMSMPVPKDVLEGIYHTQYQDVPHLTLTTVTDSRHFIMADQPKAFQSLVEAFLMKVNAQ